MMTYVGFRELAELAGGIATNSFDYVALGSDAGTTLALAASNTALGAEFGSATSAARTAGTGSVVQNAFAADTMQLVANWSFSASFTINEFGMFNASTGGDMMLRQIFADPLYVVSGDTLELTVQVQVTMPENDTDTVAGKPYQMVVQDGVARCNRLSLTDTKGTLAVFSALALGNDDGTSLAPANNNSRLGLEFIANGLARKAATVSTVRTNATDGTTHDTTRWTATWTVTATSAINEIGVFDTATAPTDDATGSTSTTSNSSGTMLLRHVFGNPLNLINGDDFTLTVDLVHE